MGFEQISNTPVKPSKEQPPYPGWILENGIWRKPIEEKTESTEQDKEGYDTETDEKLRLLEEELKKLENKKYLNSDDIQKKESLEIKYTALDKQTKKTQEKDEKASSTDKVMRSKGKGKKENLEEEITKRYYDELEKIKKMPDNTGKLKKEKVKKCFELIADWKDIAHLDNYKGIQNIFSELNKSKPSMFIYNWKKAEAVDEVAIVMASNYEEWNLEDKKKLRIIKSFVNKQSKEKNIWYQSDDKDATFKDIAQILALKDIPFKGNLDIIIGAIENPNIKSKTIAGMVDIEKKSIKEKEQLLKEVEEKITKEKIPSEAKIKELLEKMGVDASPEIMEFFEKIDSLVENPDVQEKIKKLVGTKEFKEFNNAIEKITKEKKEIPNSVAKAKNFIKGEEKQKESSWGTAFGAAGWLATLILMLFIVILIKGEDWLFGQAVGGKKKEKK